MGKTYFRKIFSSFMAMLIVLMCCCIPSSAAVIKLNRSSAIMITGKSMNLKLSGTKSAVKWSSSDTNVCTVKNGRVTAVSEGKAYVSASVGKATLKCKVNVYDSYITPVDDISLDKGKSKTINVGFYGTTSVGAIILDASIAKIEISIVDTNKLKVIVKGVSDGTTQISIYNRYDKSVNRVINVSVGTGENKIKDWQDTPTAESTVSDNYAEEMLEIINAERAKTGASPLSLDSELCGAAEIRAKEISVKFSHTRPDGSDCFTVINNLSYNYYTAGENIAWGQQSVEEAMDSWMNSSGHRANILSSSFTKVGIGYDRDTNCWVQLFVG